MINGTKPLTRLIVAISLLTSLSLMSDPAVANQDVEAIKTEIGRFVRGMEQKDLNLVLSIFKPGVSWAGHDLVNRIKAETGETFSLWNDIRIRIDNMRSSSRQGYMVTETTFNIKARVAADGSAVERNLIIRWLWEKTRQGWRVVGDNSLPGPEIPRTRPPLTGGGGGEGGMSTSIEVIGFGIKPGSKEEKQLQGVAQAGGGRYVPAKNADELIDVLSRTVERTVRENTPSTPPPPPPPPPKPAGGSGSWESLQGSGAKSQSKSLNRTPSSSEGFRSLNEGNKNWQPLNDSQKQSDFLKKDRPRQNESSY